MTRQLSTNVLGRRIVKKQNSNSKKSRYIILTYHCRALEWLNIRRLLVEMCKQFHFDSLAQEILDLVFAWKYYEPISAYLYKPSLVFKKFSFIHLLDENDACVCTKAKRLRPFLDIVTHDEN